MKPSTRTLNSLPRPEVLERLSMSLATLDAILSPEWQDRYYSFNKTWDPTKHHRMASMRNGCGDEYFILFTEAGAAIKGYAHECPMARPGAPPEGVFDDFPQAITEFLAEPAFSIENTTFCLWCLVGGAWTAGSARFPGHDDPDGSEFLLELLTADPRDYQKYARDYFEVDVSLIAIETIYSHLPLTQELVQRVNPKAKLPSLLDDFAEIGYPVAI